MRASAALLLFAPLVHAAAVYFNPQPDYPSARGLYRLAHHLGLETLLTADEDAPYFDTHFAGEKSFVGAGRSHGLVLSMSDADARDVLPAELKPSFSIVASPSYISNLIATYTHHAEHAYALVFSTATAPPPSPPRMLDLFSIPSESTEALLAEVNTLAHFLDTQISAPRFGAYELTSLAKVRAEHGPDSEQYALAAATLRATLQSAIAHKDLHLAIFAAQPSLPVHEHSKRADGSQSPLPPPSPVPQQPNGALATCFQTADACTNATSACSGRGTCMQASKAGRTCFVCACVRTNTTTSSGGLKTQDWVGEACERKDISGPFVLITGTVIALIITIAGSISLLSTIGAQELPSTLMGNAASLKRE